VRLGRGGLYGLAVAAALICLAAVLAFVLREDTGITLHGYLAMGVALLGTAAVGGGLMWLAFYSSRAGWDDLDREP
jgi:hypothetical protein